VLPGHLGHPEIQNFDEVLHVNELLIHFTVRVIKFNFFSQPGTLNVQYNFNASRLNFVSNSIHSAENFRFKRRLGKI
jgi:hypothetical protein